MKNEGKSEQLGPLIARIYKNVKDISNLNMAGLTPCWPTLEAKELVIVGESSYAEVEVAKGDGNAYR